MELGCSVAGNRERSLKWGGADAERSQRTAEMTDSVNILRWNAKKRLIREMKSGLGGGSLIPLQIPMCKGDKEARILNTS